MNDIIFKLARHQFAKTKSERLHFYRYRHLLSKNLSLEFAVSWLKDELDLALIEKLSHSAPLLKKDLFDDYERNRYHDWNNKFPKDRKFYQMILKQMSLVKTFSHKKLQDFIDSKEGREWYSRRKKLKRRPLFELDVPFKNSRKAALDHEESVRNLMRANPLLRLEDLQSMKTKNAQVIYKNFSMISDYRSKILQRLKSQVES